MKHQNRVIFQTISEYLRPVAWAFSMASVLTLSSCGGGGSGSGGEANAAVEATEQPVVTLNTKAALGEALFNDTSLSSTSTQSCATCHQAEHAFADASSDSNGARVAVSTGADGVSLGDRNTPMLTYAALIPDFQAGTHARFNSQQPDYTGWLGGLFHDGRALNLEAQAIEPLLNPVEMALADEAAVVAIVRSNPAYVAAFNALFTEGVLADIDTGVAAITSVLAEFQRGDEFATFDSKYDRSLTGEWQYDPLSKAAQGKALFFSQQFTGCATCHQLAPNGSREELFTNFEYHNIGVPENEAVRAVNAKNEAFVDVGLLDTDAVSSAADLGKFRTPSLRNVAVTAPYMHNGVFASLATVLRFYDHYFTGSANALNPETGLPWRAPEVDATISLVELEDGRALSDTEIEALVCFLETLTDARFESLIPDDGIECEGSL